MSYLQGGGFQLYIRIMDADEDSPDLIETFTIKRDLSPGNSVGKLRYTGVYGVANMDLSFTLRCAANFHGSECTVFCAPVDDATGHYTCDANGGKVCLQGWTNPAGNCLTRKPTVACKNARTCA